jgi:hypothetical protein
MAVSSFAALERRMAEIERRVAGGGWGVLQIEVLKRATQ